MSDPYRKCCSETIVTKTQGNNARVEIKSYKSVEVKRKMIIVRQQPNDNLRLCAQPATLIFQQDNVTKSD